MITRPSATLLVLALVLAPSAQAALHGQDRVDPYSVPDDLRGAKLPGANLSGLDLSGRDISGADLSGADLRDTNLKNADLSNTVLAGANLQGTRLEGANLSLAKLAGLDFYKTQVQGARFWAADLRKTKGWREIHGCDFTTADLRGAHITDIQFAGGEPPTFGGALYDKHTRWPRGFDLEQAQVTRQDDPHDSGIGPDEAADPVEVGSLIEQPGTVWARMDLRLMEWRGANLEGSDLMRCDLRFVDLRCANLRSTQLHGAQLQYANLSGADLRGANLNKAFLLETDLSGANLEGADFERVIALKQVNFRGANLARLVKMTLTPDGCDFSGADLRGANLAGAGLESNDLRGARYDRQTTWPAGFDPAAAGAVLDETPLPAQEPHTRPEDPK